MQYNLRLNKNFAVFISIQSVISVQSVFHTNEKNATFRFVQKNIVL